MAIGVPDDGMHQWKPAVSVVSLHQPFSVSADILAPQAARRRGIFGAISNNKKYQTEAEAFLLALSVSKSPTLLIGLGTFRRKQCLLGNFKYTFYPSTIRMEPT